MSRTNRFLRYISILILIAFGIFTIMASGGGGSGDDNGNNSTNTQDSNWDSMVWDEGVWG